ncbi:Asp-tRNA(Asn)/Glu-tRNA(Gln) amidotransferase subunit GatC [Candidatus Woesearchaeota archaeon]|nr:Asp-tRNA(Asn)/Glu-tRNA(Gln) amidotransferase subunit GatC [Candidatus Woesearchaeota archaeon]
MDINKELILKVAKNARLELTDQEIKEFLPQLKEVLNSFSELSKINTDKINPSFQPIDIKNKLREDQEEPSIDNKELLKNTKHKKDNYFLGPKAI